MKILLAAVVLMVFFQSCGKGESPVPLTHQYNATIRVTVDQSAFINGIESDTALGMARVDIFDDKDSRDHNLTPTATQYTGADGVATFYNLDKSYYYLRVFHPVSNISITDETSTPDGTLSQVIIIF